MSSTGITAPAGFTAAATTAGIKPSGNPDMALVVNTGPEYHAAAVFTRNRVVASPVKVSREAVADGRIRAVLFNAGNANACSGDGIEVAHGAPGAAQPFGGHVERARQRGPVGGQIGRHGGFERGLGFGQQLLDGGRHVLGADLVEQGQVGEVEKRIRHGATGGGRATDVKP